MRLCSIVTIFSVIGAATNSEFTYALFPIRTSTQTPIQHRIPLSHVRSLTELSLCGWVQHKPVYVTRESSFVTLGDKGQFRLILTQSEALIEVSGARSEMISLSQPNTRWYHICVTWQSQGGLYKMYRDGVQQISGSELAAGKSLEDLTSLTIGNSTETTPYVFAGRASLFQLYSRALNSTEVEYESCSRKCENCLKYMVLSWGDIAAQISTTSPQSLYDDDDSPIYLPPPAEVRAKLHAPQSIRVTWSDRGISSQFQWYNVRVSLVNNTSPQPSIYTTVNQDIVIGDLLKYKWYEVEVSTQSRCGRDAWSSPFPVKTKADPVPVGDLTVLNATNSSITVGWSPSVDSESVKQYRAVIYQQRDNSQQREKILDASKVNHTFTDLIPNTDYTVKIAADCDTGTGEYSSVTATTLSNRVDPDVNITVSIDILPEFEVGISWKVSDQRDDAYLYKLTISRKFNKRKRNSNAKKLRDTGSQAFLIDGENTPEIEIRTTSIALRIKGLVHYAPYRISVAICPDSTSLCDPTSEYQTIYVSLAEQYYYQQSYSGASLTTQSVQDLVLYATQNSSSRVQFTATYDPNPNSFLGKLTFSNQGDGSNVTAGEMWYTLLQAQGTTFQNTLLGPSFDFIPVNPSGYCDYTEGTEQGKGNFTWPYVRENTLTVLPCNLTNPIEAETRSRRCKVGGWEETGNYTLCPYSESTSGDIQRLLDTEITNVEEAVEVSRILTEVTSGTMTTETIGMASQAINQIVSSAKNPDISFNTDVARNLAGALGNIQSLDRQQLAKEDTATAAQSIVKDVETYCLDISGSEEILVNYASPDLKLAVVKQDSEETSDIFIESGAENATELSIEYSDKDQSDGFRDKIGVKVPKQLVKPESNVLAVIYKDKSMFLSKDKELTNADFNIPILSLSINTVEADSKLKEEVVFSLTLNNTDRHKPVCVYWNTKDNSWTTDGVEMVYSTDKTIMCKTTHLTSFSALLLPTYDNHILSIITRIGTSISVLCLLATVVLLYIVRSVRECMSTKIHINFALALFLALLFFMINTSTTYPGIYCKAMAGLTHYFFLVTFSWMSVEAMGLYRAVVLVFTSASNKTFLIVAAVVAWGLPGVVVIVLLSLQREVYQIHTNLNMCWLSRDWMYGTFFSPLLVMFLFNFLVFFRILGTIIRNRHSQTKGSVKPGQRLVEMRIIFSIMSLLGLTWIFGLIQVSSPHIALEYLFAITNTLQGVAVFVFYCLYNPNIRLALWRVAHGQSLNDSASNNSSQLRKKKKLSIKQATKQKLEVVKAHIDGNPFAFSFTGESGASKLKKMDRKNWKKLKKHDIKHTNSQLADSKGAIVLAQSRPTSVTMPTTLTSCYSPAGSVAGSRKSSPISGKSKSPELFPDLTPPSKCDDVITVKCCDEISDCDVTLDNVEVNLNVNKENVYLHGSSDQCSTFDAESRSQCSSPDQSQSSSYEKIELVEDTEADISEDIAV